MNMEIHCPGCESKLSFPDDVLTVLCPNCNQTFNPGELTKSGKRGWKIAFIGLAIYFSFYITGPLMLIFPDRSTSLSIGLVVMPMIVGLPIILTGLVISVSDKFQSGSKWIILELIIAIFVCWGFISVTSINGIV